MPEASGSAADDGISVGRGKVALPERSKSPWWELSKRLLAAVGILVGTVLLVGLLNYVPSLALGPIVEHFILWK